MAADIRTLLRLVVIAMLVVASSACSRTEFAYRNADWLLEYYAWKTVRISELQGDHWQPVLQSALRRHREEELPLVIAYLDLAGRSVEETDRQVGAACLVDGALFLYERHARLAVDLTVPLLVELDATQISHLAEYMAQDHNDAVKHYLDADPGRRKASRQERFLDRIEHWIGRLNDSQKRRIKNALERVPDQSESWLAYRAQQTKIFLTMLESGTNAEDLRKFLDAWWVYQDGRSIEDVRLWHVARDEFVRLMDQLATTLTDKQRARFQDRLGDLRSDLAPFLPSPQRPADLPLVPACASAPA